VVNDDGNVIDAVLNSCVIALMDMRKPMVNVERNEVTFTHIQIEINSKKQQMLSIAHLPISMSFFFVENNIFVDATHL
jgi:exosome complex RNA-binding protein Rrp42 (RNase PH superfamily)